SRNEPGTARSTSMEMEVMVGRIMMARMIPLARYPSPIWGPRKKGRKPSAPASAGSTPERRMGTSTNRPQRPYTTLGIPASSAMGKATRARVREGAISVRKSASPMETRTATISLAGCKHGLSLHGHLLQGRFDLLHHALRQGRVVERARRLLAFVLGPPDELEQGVALHRVLHVPVDQQIGEGGDGPRLL